MRDFKELMKLAYSEAKKSPDPSSQNGAVIVTSDGVACGFNAIPKNFGQNYTDREYKYAHVIHAEHAAILEAAKHGIPTHKATMVCPWAACKSCARYIVEAGITTLVVHAWRMGLESAWDNQIKEAHVYLKVCGVQILSLDAKIGGPSILVSGKPMSP